MIFVVAMAAGVAAAVFGWAAAALIGTGIAGAIGISNADEAGTLFALLAIGPIGGGLGLCVGVVTVFHRAGHRTFAALAWRGLVSIIAIVLIAVAGVRLAQHFDINFGQKSTSLLGVAEICLGAWQR